MDKHKEVHKYINYIKSHDVTADGRITSATIEGKVNYCKRQFDRIFKEYSKYTPFEMAERFRLLCCVDHISKGNTLIETALQYDFTPEGLSNAIRTKLNLNVEKIRQEGFELEKHIKISNSMVHLAPYKYQLKKETFMEYLEALNDEKILKLISSDSPKVVVEEGVGLHLDYKKVTNILNRFDGCDIDEKAFENLDFNESVIIYAICNKELMSGNSQFEVRVSKLFSYYFLICFFFNIETLNLKKGHYKLAIKKELRIILDSLKEIEEVTKESYDIILHSAVKGNVAIVQFGPLFKEMMQVCKEPI